MAMAQFPLDFTVLEGHSILQVAVKSNDVGVVDLVINSAKQTGKLHDLLTFQTDLGWRIIHDAAFSGDVKIVVLLLQAGSDVDSQTNNGRTPLHIAVKGARPEIIKLLIEHGADTNLKFHDRTARCELLQNALAWTQQLFSFDFAIKQRNENLKRWFDETNFLLPVLTPIIIQYLFTPFDWKVPTKI